jgi:hypothetical protein
MQDPHATREEIISLGARDMRLATFAVNCPKDLWLKAASLAPLDALDSPVGQLLVLEAPSLWSELEKAHSHEWIRAYWGLLSYREQALCAWQCAKVTSELARSLPTENWLDLCLIMEHVEGQVSDPNYDASSRANQPELKCFPGSKGVEEFIHALWSRLAARRCSSYAALAIVRMCQVNYGFKEVLDAVIESVYSYFGDWQGAVRFSCEVDPGEVWVWRLLLPYLAPFKLKIQPG